jgi:hypothetical protein
MVEGGHLKHFPNLKELRVEIWPDSGPRDVQTPVTILEWAESHLEERKRLADSTLDELAAKKAKRGLCMGCNQLSAWR